MRVRLAEFIVNSYTYSHYSHLVSSRGRCKFLELIEPQRSRALSFPLPRGRIRAVRSPPQPGTARGAQNSRNAAPATRERAPRHKSRTWPRFAPRHNDSAPFPFPLPFSLLPCLSIPIPSFPRALRFTSREMFRSPEVRSKKEEKNVES